MIALAFVLGTCTGMLLRKHSGVSEKDLPISQMAPVQKKAEMRRSASVKFSSLEHYLSQAERRGGFNMDELLFLIWSLPSSEYSKAWSLWPRLHSVELQHRYQSTLLQYWVKLNAADALRAAWSVDSTTGGLNLSLDVLKFCASDNPAQALAWVEASLPKAHRRAALQVILPALAKTDPALAMATLNELPPGLVYRQVLQQVVGQWTSRDPSSAGAYVAALPASIERSQSIEEVAKTWALRDPEAVKKWAATLSNDQERSAAMKVLLASLENREPARAAALLLEFTGTNLADGIPYISTIMANWAKSDLASAASWVNALPQGQLRDTAVRSFVAQWEKQDPVAAINFAAKLPENSAQQELVQTLAASWSLRQSQAAINWANGLPEGAIRDSALAGIAKSLTQSDPVQAANIVASMVPGDLQAKAAMDVVGRWASSDINAAAKWVTMFPEGETRENAAGRLLRKWLNTGATSAASDWLQTLPPGSTRDNAARLFVLQAGQIQPQLAAQWITAFDEPDREAQATRIVNRWLDIDPTACASWLDTTSFSDEVKQRLLSSHSSPRAQNKQ